MFDLLGRSPSLRSFFLPKMYPWATWKVTLMFICYSDCTCLYLLKPNKFIIKFTDIHTIRLAAYIKNFISASVEILVSHYTLNFYYSIAK